MLFGCLHNHIAALEANGLAAPGCVYGKLSAFIDLDARTVFKAQHSPGSRSCANYGILSNRITDLQHAAGYQV